jgi:hypothetical protein
LFSFRLAPPWNPWPDLALHYSVRARSRPEGPKTTWIMLVGTPIVPLRFSPVT